MILTLRGRSLAIPIRLYLLVRLIKRREESNLYPTVSSRTHSCLPLLLIIYK